MSNLTAKNRATNLKRAIQDILGTPIKLSQAYEILAREEGYQNWDTASALLFKEKSIILCEQNTSADMALSREQDCESRVSRVSHRADFVKNAMRREALPGLVQIATNPEIDRIRQLRGFLNELGGDASALRIACVNPSGPDRCFSSDPNYVDLSPSNCAASASAIDIAGIIGRRMIDVAVFDELKSEQMIDAARTLYDTGYIVVVMIKAKDAEFGLIYSIEHNLGDGNDFHLINSNKNSIIGRHGRINNPLNTCTSKQVCLIISSLMDTVDSWATRSCLMLEAVLDVLCYLRDTSSVSLDAKSIVKYLHLDQLVKLSDSESVPDHIKSNLSTYLKDLLNYNNKDTESLTHDPRCHEQHGYLTMSLIKFFNRPGIEIIMALKKARMSSAN